MNHLPPVFAPLLKGSLLWSCMTYKLRIRCGPQMDSEIGKHKQNGTLLASIAAS